MTDLDTIQAIEEGLSQEIKKNSAGRPIEFWRDSTLAGLALASEICMTVRMRCIREHGEEKEHDNERS